MEIGKEKKNTRVLVWKLRSCSRLVRLGYSVNEAKLRELAT